MSDVREAITRSTSTITSQPRRQEQRHQPEPPKQRRESGGNRAQEAAAGAKKEADDYIRQAADRSPVQEIADAKALLEAGTITQAEFDQLKANALAT